MSDSFIPTQSDTLLSRDALAVALTATGFPVRSATLATLVSRGDGPPYHSGFGARVQYRWGDALAWAKTRAGKPHHRARTTNRQHAAA